MYPSEKEFRKLANKGNIIPVYREISADIDTPVSAFFKAAKGKYSFLLESVEVAETVGRFSFLGSHPALVFKSKGKNLEISERGKKKRKITTNDPLDEIKKIMSRYKFVPIKGLPRLSGGLVGYAGYETVRFFEELPPKKKDRLKIPDIYFMLADSLIAFDHYQHKMIIVHNAFIPNKKADLKKIYKNATRVIDKLEVKLRSSVKISHLEKISRSAKEVKSNFRKKDFCNAVTKAKNYIKDGDVIQVVLSQRFHTKSAISAFDAYRNLRTINPSPYLYYLKFNDLHIVGSSPEMLIRCEEGKVETRPIAGTRPRGKDPAEDKKLSKELLKDHKERAEHIMLVDLGRNDLGRVCQYHSVKIKDLMIVEFYSHVMHIVSSVVGKLKKGKDAYDLFRASFPAGTVSGAPKVRAMEIINQLEPSQRGPYAGCIGYIGFSGNLDTCITIRTIVMKGKDAYVQAGAGIVADSEPENEYKETCNKARACLKALGIK